MTRYRIKNEHTPDHVIVYWASCEWWADIDKATTWDDKDDAKAALDILRMQASFAELDEFETDAAPVAKPATTKAIASISFKDDRPRKSAIIDLGDTLQPPRQTMGRNARDEIRMIALGLYRLMYPAATITISFDDECYDCGTYRPDGALGCPNPNCPMPF